MDEAAVDEVTTLGWIGILFAGDTVDGPPTPVEALADAKHRSGEGDELHLADKAGSVQVEGLSISSAKDGGEVGGIQQRRGEEGNGVLGGFDGGEGGPRQRQGKKKSNKEAE